MTRDEIPIIIRAIGYIFLGVFVFKDTLGNWGLLVVAVIVVSLESELYRLKNWSEVRIEKLEELMGQVQKIVGWLEHDSSLILAEQEANILSKINSLEEAVGFKK